MNKKIVIIPTFCESHLIECQIPNIIDTLDPDYIVYNEGLFPNGTEGNKHLTKEWLDKYTLKGEGNRGFDYIELKNIIEATQKQYPNVKIILNEMEYYEGMSSTECFVKATTNFDKLGILLEPGDYIFPLEGDVFHHENSKNEINHYLEQLEPDSGFRSRWIDFVENQYYVEKGIYNGVLRSRRICIRFGTWDFYLNVLNKYMHEFQYDMLHPTDLLTFHYSWWRPGKFKELRCDQLHRDPQYWEFYVEQLKKCNSCNLKEIKIRYNRDDRDPHAYIKYTKEFKHPKHIQNHINWKKDSNEK